MKKILIFIMALFVGFANAELRVDIIAGNTEPISIAIQDFETDDKITKKEASVLRDVVINNLERTGLFRMINRDAYPEFVKMDEMPTFQDWTAIKAQVLVQTRVHVMSDKKYKLEFYMWDVAAGEQIEAQALSTTKKAARRLAHIMTDGIYERLTGEVGYFDTQIIFIAESGDFDKRSKRMAIMDQDGFGFRYVSDKNTFVMSPHFSPDTSNVAFLSYRNEDPMIWTLDMDSGAQRRLGKFDGMTFSPRFSPDGTRIALSLAKNGNSNLYEYNLNTRELKRLTSGNVLDTSPSYSPDGKKLAFNSNRSGSQQIHILDLETLDEKRITFGNGRYATPAFSPDGNFIAFTKMADDTFYVGVMNPKGKNERILSGGWYMEAPSWAPNSRRLVYYETQKPIGKDVGQSYIQSIDIMGQNMYTIDLPRGISGVEPTWGPNQN